MAFIAFSSIYVVIFAVVVFAAYIIALLLRKKISYLFVLLDILYLIPPFLYGTLYSLRVYRLMNNYKTLANITEMFIIAILFSLLFIGKLLIVDKLSPNKSREETKKINNIVNIK